MNPHDPDQLLRSLLRGEAEWSDLRTLGVSVEFRDGRLRLEEPPDAPVYEARVEDIARGLLAHWVRSTLQEWARVVLATGTIEIACLEDTEEGELLLEALWECAEGSQPTDLALETARKVVERNM